MTSPNFVRAYPSANSDPLARQGLWFIINANDAVLCAVSDGHLGLPLGGQPVTSAKTPQLLGHLDGMPCLALDLSDSPSATPGADMRMLGIRDLYGHLPDDHFAIAGYASQILRWQRVSTYCPACATPWNQNNGEWGKTCPNCGYAAYPPVSPCVIVLVHDADRLLMTHKQGWGPRFGLVAGFVEPGESLEQCLVREVLEETGITACEPEYFASQSWPFPHQIMCGFFARYATGTINIDPMELDDARWFTVADVRAGRPTIPPALSIARQLIDHWLERHG